MFRAESPPSENPPDSRDPRFSRSPPASRKSQGTSQQTPSLEHLQPRAPSFTLPPSLLPPSLLPPLPPSLLPAASTEHLQRAGSVKRWEDGSTETPGSGVPTVHDSVLRGSRFGSAFAQPAPVLDDEHVMLRSRPISVPAPVTPQHTRPHLGCAPSVAFLCCVRKSSHPAWAELKFNKTSGCTGLTSK